MTKYRRYSRTAALLSVQPMSMAARPRRRSRGRVLTLTLPWHRIWPVALALSLLVGIMVWMRVDARWYVTTESLTLYGTRGAVAQAVMQASGLLQEHGTHLDAEASAQRIMEQVSAVREAHVTCQPYPASCEIRVVERKPIAVWETGQAVMWIDKDGVAFTPWGEAGNLPRLRGPLPATPELTLQAVKGAQALLKLTGPVEALEYHPRRGLVWNDPEGHRIAFGVGEAAMAARWSVYQQMLAVFESRRIFPWNLDVRIPEAPTYAMDRSW